MHTSIRPVQKSAYRYAQISMWHRECRPILIADWPADSLFNRGVLTYLPCIYLVWPRQPIIDQQGPRLSGLIHEEAHPVAPYLL